MKTELVRMLKHHLCSRVAPAIRNQLQKLVSPLAACPAGMLPGFTQCVFFAGEHSQLNARMLSTGLSKTNGLGWSRRRCCWLFAASLSWTGVVRKSVIACFALPGSFFPNLRVDCVPCSQIG